MSISPQHEGVLPFDSTWGAYQHYGNPNTRLVNNFKENASKAEKTAKSKTGKSEKSKTTHTNKNRSANRQS